VESLAFSKIGKTGELRYFPLATKETSRLWICSKTTSLGDWHSGEQICHVSTVPKRLKPPLLKSRPLTRSLVALSFRSVKLVPASTTQLSPTAWRRIPPINPIRVFLWECTVMQGPTINRTSLLSLDPKGPFSTPLSTPPPKKRENTSIYFPQLPKEQKSGSLPSINVSLQ
jgi:hypothetical protein